MSKKDLHNKLGSLTIRKSTKKKKKKTTKMISVYGAIHTDTFFALDFFSDILKPVAAPFVLSFVMHLYLQPMTIL